MKNIYLIHAKTKTPEANTILADDGAIPFSSDTYLHTDDILSPQRFARALPVPLPGDVVVCPIFTPNCLRGISGDYIGKARLGALLEDLWGRAFHLPKENG